MTVVSIALVLAASLAFAGVSALLLLKALFHAIGGTMVPPRATPQD